MTPHERATRIVDTRAEDPVAFIQAEIEEAIAEVLDRVGQPGRCKGCGASVWWVRHNNNKTVPYSRRGVIHFIDCPNAKDFKKPHRAKAMFE